MAKPIPTLPPDGEKIIEFMPMTWPRRSKVGPPELPRLIGASIWMKSVYGPFPISRPSDETVAAVTGLDRPNGLPTATTQSPTRTCRSSPNSTVGSGLSLLILSSATSVSASLPISLASKLRPSGSLTVILCEFSMTWLLVTTSPPRSMMKPEPAEIALRGAGEPPWPYWLKKLRNGAGRSSVATGPVTTVSAVMVTTAGLTRSTRSAKLKGAPFSNIRGGVERTMGSAAATRRGSLVVSATGRTPGTSAKALNPIRTMAPADPMAMALRWRLTKLRADSDIDALLATQAWGCALATTGQFLLNQYRN